MKEHKPIRKIFVALRISVLWEAWPLFEKTSSKPQPQEVINRLSQIFENYPEFKPAGKPYLIVFGDYLKGPGGDLIAFKLGKYRERKIPQYDEERRTFETRRIPVSPNLICLFFKEVQSLLVEKKSSAFPIKTLKEVLEEYCNYYLAQEMEGFHSEEVIRVMNSLRPLLEPKLDHVE